MSKDRTGDNLNPILTRVTLRKTNNNNGVDSRVNFLKRTCDSNKRNLRNILHVNRKNMIKLGMWNARSVNIKVDSLSDIVISNALDVFIITETWLKQGSEDTLYMLGELLLGYQITSVPRGSRGGGLAILSRKEFTSKMNRGKMYASFEFLDLFIIW